VEVGTHAVPQTDGFANVNNCPFGIAVDITTWLGRQRGKDALQFLRDVHRWQL